MRPLEPERQLTGRIPVEARTETDELADTPRTLPCQKIDKPAPTESSRCLLGVLGVPGGRVGRIECRRDPPLGER